LRGLHERADTVILDIGSGHHELARNYWRAADKTILVTTSDSAAVMETYATIKTVLEGEPLETLALLVNREASASEAADVHRRIQQSCRRFLGIGIESLGPVPDNTALRPAHGRWEQAAGWGFAPAQQAVARIAQRLLSEVFVASVIPLARIDAVEVSHN